MGFGDFQLNNNGKKEQLRDVKQGVRKEQLDKKYHALFDAYDVNKDGTLEAEELNGILKGLQSFAGADKVLDSNENLQAKSIFASEANIQDADFQGFVKSVSKASVDIVNQKEVPTSDGGKEVTTTYKDGTVETISYYPDGDFKFKKVDSKSVQTNYYYTVGRNVNKKFTAQQIENMVKKEYKEYKKEQNSAKQDRAKQGRTIDGSPSIVHLSYSSFKYEYLKLRNINKNSDTKTVERHDFELSERGKQDVAVRDFVLSEYIETHQAAKEALASMGFLDDTGALINAGAGELWNAIKNKWNGTEEEYQNFYELLQKFSPGVIQEKIKKNLVKTAGTVGNILTLNSNFSSALTTIFDKISNDETSEMGSYEKSLQVKEFQELAQQHQENYFRGEIGQIDTEKGAKFQQTTEQYQNAQILNIRLNLLKEAMLEVELYDAENTSFQYTSMPGDVNTSSSHIVKAKELLLQYFGGDQEAVNMILNGAMGDNNSKVVNAIKDIYEETQKMNTAVLGGKSFDEVRSDYQNQYKEMYGTDFVPDELTEKVMDAKVTGSMVKLAAITIISILITRSPMMAEINSAIAGSAEATGAAANLMRSLVAKYGQTAVTQGVKFAMTSGTLAADVGLTLINQLTSENGYNGQELLESAKGSAKYIYFGAYIGAPVAEAVGSAVSKIGLAKGLMSGGATTTQGAIKTTTLTGDKVFENILNTGKGIGQKLAVGGAKFGTDVAMFSALGIATDGQEIGEAFAEQSTFLPKLKIMNHVLEYVMGRALGGKVGAQPSLTSRPQDVRMETAIEKSGIKNWTIQEMKSPSGARYTVVDDKGIPQTFNDVNKLVTAMMERVAKTYETVAPKTQATAENKGEVKAQETTAKEVAPTETICASEVKSEENLEYKANNILDKVYDETTIPKAKSRLKEMGFTEEEINSIDIKDANVQRIVEVFINLLKIKPEIKENLNKAEIAEILSNKEELENSLKEEAKFFTEENCEIITKHVIFDDGGDITEIVRDYNNPEKVMSLLPILTQNGKHKVFGSQLGSLGYKLDNPENIAKITPEKIDLMYKINDQIENKKYGIELDDILNLDNVSSELANDYVKEANRFSKFGIENISEKTLEETVSKRKAVSDFLEQYPIDLTCKDYEGNLKKLSGNSVYKLSQSTNKAEVQKFVNSLSTEARENYAGYSRYIDKGFSTEKLANLINEYQKGDFGKIQGDIYKLLDAMLETGSKDYDSMIDLINAYKGTKVLSWYGNEKYIQVANGDYKGAVKYIEKLKELGIDLEHKNRVLNNINSDYNLINEYIKKGFSIEFSESVNRYNEVLIKKLLTDRGLNFEDTSNILRTINKDNVILAEKLCADKDFPKEQVASILYATNKDNIAFAEKLYADKDFPKEHIADILSATNKDKIAFAEKLCADKDIPKEHIADILWATNKDKIAFAEKLCADKEFPKEYIQGIVRATNKDNIAFAEKLYADKEFPKEHIAYILSATDKDNIAFAEKLCADKNFPKEHIADILSATNKDKIAFAEKLCADKEFPKEHIASILKATNKDNIAFTEKLCADKNIPKDKISEIINATKINDPNDAGGNNGKTDSKKIDRYSRLFQNQATAKWAGDMLKQGFDIETISKLAPTKQSFFTESVDNVASKQVVETQKALSPLETIRVETIQEFESIGLDTKQANAVYKAISKNGVVDASLKLKAIDLINKGVAKNKIGDILNSAQITGEFNSKIVDDFILLQNKGLNPLLEKNLAVLNNISGADCATKFNSKVRNQMKAMINNLPDAVKNSLTEQGIGIDSILKKLGVQIVRTSTNVPTRAKVESGFRSKAKITGFERIVIDKYEPTEQIWRNEEATKKWAEEKYTEYKNREYVSTRNTSEDPQLGEKVTQKRKEMLQEWYNFMETDENIKNNPFVKVILCDFITKELEPERSTTPPVLDKDVVKQILGDAANSSNFSFSNAYAKKMKELSAKNSNGQHVEINGRKGTWYTVPKTDSSSPDFKTNAAKIRAFSDGTNWCIRTWNAEPYVQKGAMHFFVDENGLTQICIREDGASGSVYEIQKRQQDQSAPVAYLDVIQSYMTEHELKPQNYCQGELDKAIAQKPQYDKLKSELDVLNNKKDYKGILEKMGITVNVLSDGTFELSHYTSYIDKIALNDFGINENELLANVSKIQGNASFKDSNVTALPLLQEVGGKLDFGYANISNIKNLQKINGKNIQW